MRIRTKKCRFSGYLLFMLKKQVGCHVKLLVAHVKKAARAAMIKKH